MLSGFDSLPTLALYKFKAMFPKYNREDFTIAARIDQGKPIDVDRA